MSSLVHFLLLLSASLVSSPVVFCSSEINNNLGSVNQTFHPHQEVHKLRTIRTRLQQINKPPVKIIQSPDGDIIDCVVSHQQPAFDHPMLKGHKPQDPPDRPKGHNKRGMLLGDNFQLWRLSGESCPEGTIPIRRTREEDLLRASSVQRFGRKLPKPVRRDTNTNGHEHAVGYVSGDEYYGARASINVWAPSVANQYEFSLSQIWVISGSFGDDLNTIEAGWQVSPELYGDNYPRFFTYWTSDAYQATGCYNLLCSGFVQTNNKIAIGAAISPTSSYNGGQFDISLVIWKDPKHGNWWLEFGSGSCKHGTIWRGGGEFGSFRVAHFDPDGKRAFRRRGVRKSLILSELASCRLGQQLDSVDESSGVLNKGIDDLHHIIRSSIDYTKTLV
ncbi:hypothetical protein K1719_003975 [Acacia pycnantha]|nr:hypothetical protein K1719_003975 [Acacia pycnantha]